MLLKKGSINRFLWLFVFIAVFLVTRILFLGPDEINPDAVNWHYRSEQFVVGLKTGQLEKTFQHYHPGVTLMWIMGPAVEILKQIYPENAFYTHLNFMAFHTVAKVTLIFVQLVLSVLLIYLLSQALNNWKLAILATTLFSFETFFVGNSRLLHLDVLVTLFLIIALVQAYLAIIDFKWSKAVLTGIFLSLAFLTKSVSIGAVLFVVVFSPVFVLLLDKYSKKQKIKISAALVLVTLFSFAATTFILFPAMWKEPVFVLREIFSESERVGVRKGHDQIFFGKETTDPGPLFYSVVLALKITPFLLLLLFGGAIKLAKKIKKIKNLTYSIKTNPIFAFCLYLGIFYLGYILVMTFPTKKLDRYMLLVFPYLGILGALALTEFVKAVKLRIFAFLGFLLIFAAFYLYPLVKYYPYYFTYTSPLFGSSSAANKIIAHKSFGIGVPALREDIFKKFGDYPTLGMIDTKPMEAIYMNSRIFDVRVAGTKKYDVLVLAINEQMPRDVLEGEDKFVYDSSIFINGLDYWRIYAKQNKDFN